MGQEENLGALLSEVARVWRAKLDARLRPLGLSQAKWLPLLELERRGDGMSQRELAGYLGIEGPTLVSLLDRLTQDGWVERRESAADRRIKTVHLTGKAREVVPEIEHLASELRQSLLSGISPHEIEATVRTVRAILARAEKLP